MDALFSCRNCIHNCGQTINIGRGTGFCLKHNSVLREPEDTTCKYLHRKDLPRFTVDEGIREHAAEFVFFSSLVRLSDRTPLEPVRYSERFSWEQGAFSPVTHALALYHRMKPHWVMVQAFGGGVDGVRAIVHASLVRHYLDNCGHWKSSYRLILSLVQELDVTPKFGPEDIFSNNNDDDEEEALWDVVFVRLAGLQEYGWHAGIEDLTWITDSLNGALTRFDWPKLQKELRASKAAWTGRLIQHAKDEGVFFQEHERLQDPADFEPEE